MTDEEAYADIRARVAKARELCGCYSCAGAKEIGTHTIANPDKPESWGVAPGSCLAAEIYKDLTRLAQEPFQLLRRAAKVQYRADDPAAFSSSKETGLICAECREPQYETPSGTQCKNGHGGAASLTPFYVEAKCTCGIVCTAVLVSEEVDFDKPYVFECSGPGCHKDVPVTPEQLDFFLKTDRDTV